jgi:predicted transposase YbfD/YdcC
MMCIPRKKTEESGHGRQERRVVSVWNTNPARDRLSDLNWPKLNSMLRVESSGIRQGKPYQHVRYLISSLSLPAQTFSTLVRNHWHIENNCHRVLDTVFKEDHTPTSNTTANCVYALFRKIIVNLLQTHSPLSVGLAFQRLSNRPDLVFPLLL